VTRQNPINLLECRPERAVAFEGETERIVLLRPRFLRGPLAWWLQPLLRRPFFRVHLDDVGSFVWSRCDGRANVAEIADAMEVRFGERVAPAIDRLQIFLRQLEAGHLIRMHLPSLTPSPPLAE
jgi:hypothetical protein